MNPSLRFLRILTIACTVFLMGRPTVFAQEDDALPDDDVPAVVDPVVDDIPAPPPPPPVEVPVEEIVAGPEPVTPPKAPPSYHGADMRAAFKGTVSSKFGMGGRVNKLPRRAARKKSEGWRRSIELGVDTAQGNRDTLRAQAAASASKETEQHFYFLKGTAKYGESDGEQDAENGMLEAKVQHRISERSYSSLGGTLFHDQVADLSYRAIASLSLGGHLIRTTRTALSIEAGPGYVAEKKGGEQEGFVAARFAQYAEFMVTTSLQVWQSIEYLPSLEETDVFFVNAEAGLETLLLSNLSLKLSVESRYDSNPAQDRENNELLTSTALVWNF